MNLSMLQNITCSTRKIGQMVMCKVNQKTEKIPDDWIRYTEYLVEKAQEDVKKGINLTHIFQEFILMGVLVGNGYSPKQAYETVEAWEQTGKSKLLQESKKMT
jgi:hypothetical protein